MKAQFSWLELIVTSTIAMTTLAACGGSGGGSAAPAPVPAPAPTTAAIQGPYGFNEDLRAEAQAVVALSSQQKADILRMMDQNDSFLALDDLYFKNFDSEEDRQKELSHFNGEGVKLYNNVKKNCQVISPAARITGALAQNTPQVIKVDRQISGSNCPIGFTSTSINTMSAYNLSVAPQANGPAMETLTQTSVETLKSQESVVDQDLASNPNTIVSQNRNVEVDNNYAAFQFITGGAVLSGTAHSRKVSTADHTLSSGVTFKSTVKTEITVNKTDRHLQLLYKLEFSDGKKLIIGAFNDNNVVTVWVNGQAATLASVQHDLKMDLSGATDLNPWLQKNLKPSVVSSGT